MIFIVSLVVLVGLLVLHEASHFLVAKGFGIGVREFGIGYPPRLIGKKIGETVYSLNLIPFGAFVDIPRENMKKAKISHRFWVLAAGVISFWVFAFLIFSIMFMAGAPVDVGDEPPQGSEPLVSVLSVAPDSPAEEAGLKPGDIILEINGESLKKITKVQEFVQDKKGEEIEILVKRGDKEVAIEAVPRISPPEGEGLLGIGLGRVVIQKKGVFESLKGGAEQTFWFTALILRSIGEMIASPFTETKVQARLVGPVGIMGVFVERGRLGASYFLNILALIALHLAVFNAFPLIPVLDGGRILFLGVEKLRGKPLKREVEEGINKFFFVLLLLLMVFATFKDIKSLL